MKQAPPWTGADAQRVIQLVQNGETFERAGATVGRSADAVRRLIKSRGIVIERASARCEDDWEADAVAGTAALARAIQRYQERRAA